MNNLIDKIKPEDITQVLGLCVDTFKYVMSPNGIKSYLKHSVDWKISKKATLNGKIIGCYLLREGGIPHGIEGFELEDLSKYKDKKGIEVIALAVSPEVKGKGYGKKLRDAPLRMGYDYIWGQHFKGLNNADNWIRFGRRIVAETDQAIITLMDLKKTEIKEDFSKHHIFQKESHTCGPTCVKIVSDFLEVDYDDFDSIVQLCGCNTTTGTVDSGIKNALDKLNIKNQRNPHLKNGNNSLFFLDETLINGGVFIMRTLTHGIKHWIIVYGKSGVDYLIADPWLGLVKYDILQLNSIWQPRDFDGFAVFN